MQKFLDKISFYLSNFYAQDLILLGLCFLFFIIVLIAAIFLRRFAVFSLLLIVFGIVFEIVLFIMGESYINATYRPSELEFINNRKLAFSDNIHLNLRLHNRAEHDYKICRLKIIIKKPSKNTYMLIKNSLKPLKTIELTLRDIPAGKYAASELIIPSKLRRYTIASSAACF